MCIIIQGNPVDITKKHLKNAYRNNPHGFGLTYLLDNKVINPNNRNNLKKPNIIKTL